MHYEHSSVVSRETWKFSYKGSELFPIAKKMAEQFRRVELALRDNLASLLKNPSVPQDSPQIGDLRRDITFNSKQHEACTVFYAGCKREPDREFQLAMGDVVYFGLNKLDDEPNG